MTHEELAHAYDILAAETLVRLADLPAITVGEQNEALMMFGRAGYERQQAAHEARAAEHHALAKRDVERNEAYRKRMLQIAESIAGSLVLLTRASAVTPPALGRVRRKMDGAEGVLLSRGRESKLGYSFTVQWDNGMTTTEHPDDVELGRATAAGQDKTE